MKILILDDSIPGNTNQSSGIAEALNPNFQMFSVDFKGPSYRLPGRKGSVKIAAKIIGLLLRLKAYRCAYKAYRYLSKNGMPKNLYDIVISAGSYLAPVNLLISKKINAKSICVMTPDGLPLEEFDLLIVPFHDAARYPKIRKSRNIFFTLGAPNRITHLLLNREKEKLLNEIKLKEGSIKAGVIIGGNDQNYFIDDRWAKMLFDLLKKLSDDNFVFLITVSRRTPEEVIEFLRKNSYDINPAYCEFPGTKHGIHYFGILGVCDILFVTEDSVTMISEACSTGKPVVILGVNRRKRKQIPFDMTIRKLVEKGYCIYTGMNDSEKIVETVKKMLRKKVFPILNESKKCALKIKELMNQTES
ncbi:MAG: mitochondrial fission ELM1 family protein [Candidatus Omnitrophica bacterium]|nr:mitochondrial fission ELM1 family protein [Candidatus Omnitrophota bacterium]MCM8829333.1 mitochondrial fission ELM1 family protein [Candidatus Omnitrophota bacterium]